MFLMLWASTICFVTVLQGRFPIITDDDFLILRVTYAFSGLKKNQFEVNVFWRRMHIHLSFMITQGRANFTNLERTSSKHIPCQLLLYACVVISFLCHLSCVILVYFMPLLFPALAVYCVFWTIKRVHLNILAGSQGKKEKESVHNMGNLMHWCNNIDFYKHRENELNRMRPLGCFISWNVITLSISSALSTNKISYQKMLFVSFLVLFKDIPPWIVK